MADLLTVSALTISIVMLITWVVSVLIDDASIVDIVWGFGFVAATGVAFLTADTATDRSLLVLVMVTIWGLRLSGYLAWRNIGEGEDRRYRQMRKKSPDTFWLISLWKVFGLQAVIMWVVAVPAVVTQGSTGSLSWIDFAGLGLWMVGLVFESVGDFQLARFKAGPDSKGKVMDRGLWRHTRHPNYFGDFCVWWGFYLLALAAGAWWTVIGPLIMSVLLLRVSGVTLLERDISERRPGYREYLRRTNAFFPGPPREH